MDVKVELAVSKEYDVIPMPDSTNTTYDPEVAWGSTSVAFAGQPAFKVKLTRVITWPDGRSTSGRMDQRLAGHGEDHSLAHSTTLPGSSNTGTTTATSPPTT